MAVIVSARNSVGLLLPHPFTKVFLGPAYKDVEHTVPRLFIFSAKWELGGIRKFMLWYKIDKKVNNFILSPIHKSPISFFIYGILLFIPEVFKIMSWERGTYIAAHFLTTVAFCFMISWLICLIAKLLGKFGIVFHIFAHFVIFIIALADITLFKFFYFGEYYTALELILQTDANEAKEFFEVYLINKEWLSYLGIFISILIVEILCYLWLRTFIINVLKFIRRNGWIYILFGVGLYNLIYFFFPTFVPNRTHLQTIDEPILKQSVLWGIKNGSTAIADAQNETDLLEDYISDLRYDTKVELVPNELMEAPPKNIVLIIGESYNKYHTPFYNYPLHTTPRQEEFNPIVFKDVISPVPLTHQVFRTILSANSADESWTAAPLFPALFKGDGWNVSFCSNQFIKSAKPSMVLFDFLVDATLSRPKIDAACFNFHNKERFDYDGDFVDKFLENRQQIEVQEKNLTIIHFMGQHIYYRERYPEGLGHFTIDSIARPELDEEGRTYVMHYDNATYYNDIQIGKILEAYRDSDAVIIATADHGDEIYDFRPQVGRSTLYYDAPIGHIKTHVDVPFLVFATERYKETHPKTTSLLESAASKPFMIDDITHVLLHLGGVQTAWYDAKKNPLHPDYDTTKHRILKIGGIDYDEKCRGEFKIGY